MSAGNAKSFQQLPYQRVDFEYLANEFRRARLRLRLAMSPAAAAAPVKDMQAALRLYRTQATIARIRHDLKTDDQFYADEQAYYDQADARISLLEQSFYSTLLSSRLRPDLEKRYGSLIFRKAENLRDIVRSTVVDDLAEENRLSSAYLQLMSAATIQLGEQTMALSQLQPLLQSPDRAVRARAHRAQAGWFAGHAENLDSLFDQLVTVRHNISQKLGFASFTDLGYKRMERFDYYRADVENLRQAVIRYIVPLTREIRRLQKRRLNLEGGLFYYDLPCLFQGGNPALAAELDKMPDAAQSALAAVTGQQPSFLAEMLTGGYLDLKARNNKTPGAYCQTIINAGTPFILMNATGTAQDVATLLHESGHAYASLRSLQDLTLIEYLSPTLDACEIHSTALEYLCYPQMELFFGENAENYRLMHMTEAMLFLPYGCMVDEFQHIIYDQPMLTPAERHAVWRDLEKIYQPDIDYDDESFYLKGGAWQKKVHIFTSPFYYIDYVLAQFASLDLWLTSRKEPAQAWRSYDKLCAQAGKDTFSHLLDQAGIASPFDSGTIKRLAYAVSRYLEL